MDISTLTNLINAFRAENRQDAITPDTLGQLLQKIVNVLEQAGDSATIQQISQWKNMITAFGSVLKSISLGADDRNNILLNIQSVNTTTGGGQISIFTIRQATTARAGAMRAQQVTDLNSVRNKMNHVEQLELKVEATASSVQMALYDKYGDVFNDQSKLQVNMPMASHTQAGMISAADYNKLWEEYDIPTSVNPFYHIECDSRSGKLYLKYPAELITEGYIPYLLRFSKKRPRYRTFADKTKHFRGPTMRGWHLYYDEKKISLQQNGEVLIGKNTGTDKNPVWEYSDDKTALFKEIRPEWKTVGIRVDLVGYRIGFGSRTYKINSNHRFRFGIVFGPPLAAKGNRSLDFTKCVTNIAEFYVNFKFIKDENIDDEPFIISYSI